MLFLFESLVSIELSVVEKNRNIINKDIEIMRTEVEAAINFFAEKFFSDSRQESQVEEISEAYQRINCV